MCNRYAQHLRRAAEGMAFVSDGTIEFSSYVALQY